MTTITKPGLDVDVIAVPATAIVCGATECDAPATEMFHHSHCQCANPACAHHATEGREYLARAFAEDGEPYHLTCKGDITPENHSFRPI